MPTINTAFQVPLPYQTMARTDGSGVTGSFMQAYQSAQQKNDPLYKLRMAALDQDLQMRSFEMSKSLEDRQSVLNAEAAARQAAPAIKNMLNTPYEAYQAMIAATVQNPDLEKAPTWRTLADTVRRSVDLYDKLEDNKRLEAESLAKASFMPTVETVKAADGKDIKVLRKSPNEVQLIPEGMAPGDLQAVPVKDEKGNVITYALPGATGPRYVAPKGPTLGVATKEEIKSIYKQIEDLQVAQKKAGTSKMGWLNRTTKDDIQKQIDVLKAKAKALEVTQPDSIVPAPAPEPQPEPAKTKLTPLSQITPKLGDRFRNALGQEAIYVGGDITDTNSFKIVPPKSK